MTQAELIAALPNGRLPQSLMQLHATDLIALVGIGLLLAALLSSVIMPFFERKPSRKTLIRATRGIPAQERALAIARILGHLPAELRATAYGVALPLSEEVIERIALKARPARR